jgi:N-acetylmuramoyl-L-alanine amidase
MIPAPRRLPAALLSAILLLTLAAGGQQVVTPSPSAAPSVSAEPSVEPTPAAGQVVPAPGSDSELYAPNPAAITVAIDPGHGGCLDWGVPNPWDNTVDKAEKTDTLAIGLALAELLAEQGVNVVLTRTDDSALAGDDYPDLGCHGPEWRDVDGDGQAGFEETGRIRTRDELQARIDLANVARADVLVSIHINSMTQNGVAYEIAATQTFYDDETPWGEEWSGGLGRALQSGVVAALDGVDYERQDRGTEAVAYYLVSRQWQDGDACETPGDTWCKPHRGVQMPTVLSEVGSMSLEAESELLSTDDGRRTVARGLYEGLVDYFAERPLAVSYAVPALGSAAPQPQPGDGPPFWTPVIEPGELPVVLTNTGTAAWPQDLSLLVGWEPSDLPYLPAAPAELTALEVEVPALAPGESVELRVGLPSELDGRHLGWISLAHGSQTLADLGFPALQVAVE